MKADTLVIAHRGASGYLPEHTREAKVLAYGQGADFLEQDIVATRDGRLVVLHDTFLDDVTDVASRFPNRCREDGHYYVIDFDLSEIRSLNVVERRRPGTAEILRATRFSDESISFGVVTLEEEIALVQELNRTTGRRVGIYPEIKQPVWHRQNGFDLSAALLEVLDDHGYREADDLAFVQCFNADELKRCRNQLRTRLKLVQLVDEKTGSDKLTPTALARIAVYADVIAPHHSQLIAQPPMHSGAALEMNDLARQAEAAGLPLHPYTFRRDRIPSFARDLEQLLEFFINEVKVGGVFCDHPDLAVRVRERGRQ